MEMPEGWKRWKTDLPSGIRRWDKETFPDVEAGLDLLKEMAEALDYANECCECTSEQGQLRIENTLKKFKEWR